MSLIHRNIAAASGMVAFLLLALVPAPAAGQRNSVSLEADPFRSTRGYARETAPVRQVGVEIGFGSPQLDQTLLPGNAGRTITGFVVISLKPPAPLSW